MRALTSINPKLPAFILMVVVTIANCSYALHKCHGDTPDYTAKSVRVGPNDRIVTPLSFKDTGDGSGTLQVKACGYMMTFRVKNTAVESEAFKQFLFDEIAHVCEN